MTSLARSRRAAVSVLVTLAAFLVIAGAGAPGSGLPTTIEGASASPVLDKGAKAAGREQRRAAKQAVTTQVLPPLAQPGPTAEGFSEARPVVLTSVSPPKPRRPVVLELRREGTWRRVAATRTDRSGRALIVLPVGASSDARYRVTAQTFKRQRAVSGATFRPDRWSTPTFHDDFEGTALGSSWSGRVQDYDPAGLRSCSRGDMSAVSVGGGSVQLSVLPDPARLEPCPAYSVDGTLLGQFRYRLNGHISTATQQEFRFGFAAARMRFPKPRGQHAAFWLQPAVWRPDATTAAEGGSEIDVIEWFGAEGDRGGLASFIYHPSPAGRQKVGGKLADADRFLADKSDRWWRRYHVFSLEWTPTEYVFRIDGQETWRTSEGISQVPQYPILSLLSSDYELKNLRGEDRLPQHLNVDWMAFWQA